LKSFVFEDSNECEEEILILVFFVIWFRTGISGMTVSSTSVHPALNGYLEKSGDGKQQGYRKALDG